MNRSLVNGPIAFIGDSNKEISHSSHDSTLARGLALLRRSCLTDLFELLPAHMQIMIARWHADLHSLGGAASLTSEMLAFLTAGVEPLQKGDDWSQGDWPPPRRAPLGGIPTWARRPRDQKKNRAETIL